MNGSGWLADGWKERRNEAGGQMKGTKERMNESGWLARLQERRKGGTKLADASKEQKRARNHSLTILICHSAQRRSQDVAPGANTGENCKKTNMHLRNVEWMEAANPKISI